MPAPEGLTIKDEAPGRCPGKRNGARQGKFWASVTCITLASRKYRQTVGVSAYGNAVAVAILGSHYALSGPCDNGG